jgi:hypothetical protein
MTTVTPVTMVVTSFGRPDMLSRMLSSFFAVNDYPLERVIIAEDGDDDGVFSVAAGFPGQPIEVMLHGERIGQHRSIDRAYAAVKTEYIFHSEDDYEFGRGGIIRESVDILEAEPAVLIVSPRARNELPYFIHSVPVREVNDARYRLLGPRFHDRWYSFTFTPGLRRLSDYRTLAGGYAAFRREMDISLHYKRQGRGMAILEDGQARDTGQGRTTRTFGPRVHRPLGVRLTKLNIRIKRVGAHYLRLIGIGDGSK